MGGKKEEEKKNNYEAISVDNSVNSKLTVDGDRIPFSMLASFNSKDCSLFLLFVVEQSRASIKHFLHFTHRVTIKTKHSQQNDNK